MTLNRRQKRAGWPEKAGDHICANMQRLKALDHSLPPMPCGDCQPDRECAACNNGILPAVDWLGYKCGCGRAWVQMQYVLKGERHASWRSLDDLRVGSTQDSQYPFGQRR